MGCHCLLRFCTLGHAKSPQSCPTLCNPMVYMLVPILIGLIIITKTVKHEMQMIDNINSVLYQVCGILEQYLGPCCSVTQVVSDSLQPHGLQHTRFPCPSPSPRACSNSRPSSQRYHPTISSSVVPFSSCPQFFSASGGLSIRASASAPGSSTFSKIPSCLGFKFPQW